MDKPKRKRLAKVSRLYFYSTTAYRICPDRRATAAIKARGDATEQVNSSDITLVSTDSPRSLQQLVRNTLDWSVFVLQVASYFASKPCTYTDSSGRPVPPPRQPDTQQTQQYQFPQPAQSYPSPSGRKRSHSEAAPETLDPLMTRELTNRTSYTLQPCFIAQLTLQYFSLTVILL